MASAPAILPHEGSPTNLGYWNGTEWARGPVASTWARSWGNAIDVVIASIVFAVLLTLFFIPVPTTGGPEPTADPAAGTVAFFAALILGFVGYFALSYRFGGRTIGMRLSGTYVVHVPSGQQNIPWGAAILRALVLTLGYACGVLWVIWLILTATSRTKQGPHDLAAKTGVLALQKKVHTAPAASASPSVSSTGLNGPEIVSPQPDPAPDVAPVDIAPDVPEATALPETPAPAVPPPPPSVTVEHEVVSDGAPHIPETTGEKPATIFISHASKDAHIAQSLAKALQEQGLETWLASRDVSIGANYAAEIFQNLVNSDYLLVVLSANSIESAHVRREVSIAIDRKVPVLPVSTDPSGELMANLPEDWQYWLNIAQVFRMTDESSTAVEIARRVT